MVGVAVTVAGTRMRAGSPAGNRGAPVPHGSGVRCRRPGTPPPPTADLTTARRVPESAVALTLHIDTARWRGHQEAVLERLPGLVPVCKGNGYGFGLDRLAREATRLGAGLLAVGTVHEALRVQDVFEGDLLVLTPHHRHEARLPLHERVVRTLSTVDGPGAHGLAGARVVVKLMSSMRRHGVHPRDLHRVRTALRNWQFEGFSIHLPLDRPAGAGGVGEIVAWMDRLRAAGLPRHTLFVSHLSAGELARLRERFPRTAFRPRVGTGLWLGDPKATQYRSTVLDVVDVARGERFGVRQRPAPADGHLAVVAGGTSHGIGLSAPRLLHGARQRARHIAGIGYALANRHLSPFVRDGRRYRFAEPPDVAESVLFIPAGRTRPVPGESLVAQLRYTITRPDRVVDAPHGL